MDSISTARNFFINQQGLSPDQADMLVSKGMEAYNQQMQPQSMMQMASGGIARLGYQMGGSPMGVQAMPMDTGQALQVPQQAPTNFSSAQSITANPLLNYGQTQLAQGGATPLTMRSGGIARLGYQDGGEAMMQPQMGGGDMSQMAQMDPQKALTIILQMLVEKGIPLEEAKKLAFKIIELFTQGGAPAVQEFANQLKQQEQQGMASGGIAGYARRQGYGWGSFVGDIIGGAADFVGDVVGGIGDAVGSIAKSPIGKIALTAAAVYFGGPMLASGLGISSAAGAALAGGLANSALQIASGQKFNPLEALISAGGAYAGAGGFGGGETSVLTDATTGATTNAGNIAEYVSANPVSSASTAQTLTNPEFITGTITQPSIPTGGFTSSFPTTGTPDVLGTITQPSYNLASTYTGTTGLEGQIGTGYAAPKPNLPYQLQGAGNGSVIDANAITSDYSYPGTLDKLKTSASNFGTDMLNKAQTGVQNLYQDPLGTITKLAGSAYDTVKENIVPLSIGFATGIAAGSPQQPGESDEDFAKRQQQEVNPLLTLYGRNLQIRNPNFYKQYGAVNPFETAAEGGIMGYRNNYGGAGMVSPRSEPNPMAERNDLAIQLFGKPIHQLTPAELDQLENFIREKFGKTTSQEETVFAARGGSMVPPARQIEGGILELDARKSGGYIPYGKKERVDDVPAMLAKDEFVFTSKAVKAAGGGNARRGAAKMYALMKKLEGARA